MCGIAGIIGSDTQAVRRALTAMVAAQRHRGPDDQGQTVQPFGPHILGLGHRRLSIIDLTSAGHQPMIHPQSGDQIVFNGEIYNFELIRQQLLSAGEKFAGHSDTEVLLHALARWGPDCIKRLEGMFAFAFYNAKDRTLLLARDSVGIKPLYVGQQNGYFVFASEVRAVLASGLVERTLDPQGMASFLAYGAVQQPATLFRSIHSFPPGHYQIVHAESPLVTVSPQPFWNVPRAGPDRGEATAITDIQTTLEASVKDHLVADVPVGVFLSSGLDSTIVAGLAAKHTNRLRSFCVGFADQPDLSEDTLAGETARIFGLDYKAITINGTEAEHAATQWLAALDQPSIDGLNVYIISQALRREGITVALSGQGGDELFGGYPSFADVPRLRNSLRYLCRLPMPLRLSFAALATFKQSEAVKQKFRDMVCTTGSVLDLYLQRRRAMSDGQLATLGLDASLGMLPGWLPPGALDGVEIDESDIVWSVSALESRFYQGNMLLRDSDTNAMAHGLEIRVPILDQRMLNLMLSVPGNIRLPNRRADKHLLRAAFSPMLRDNLLRQKKRGFTLPIRRWMLGPLREMCESAMQSLKSLEILRPQGIDAIWNSFLKNPESPIWTRAFGLSVLGVYLKQIEVVPPSNGPSDRSAHEIISART
ncbi:MAG TPA: asparagine synthase (glutamine-hydrolyzing) [Tepidisphaeraceae bacterium]|nr:asparagine synthase (glutamine-hydrolyzing) [Tepidisphaeraceae bacterium]